MGLRTLLALLFFQLETLGYLVVNWMSSRRRPVYLGIPADARLAFRPRMLWLYLSFVPFCLSSAYGFRTLRRLARTLACLTVASAVSYRSFLRSPSPYPRPPTALDDGLLASAWATLRATDRPCNTFPSLHVGHAVLLALALADEVSEEEADAWLLWALLISLSTVGAKQHWVIDVAGGLLVAETVATALHEPWAAGRLDLPRARRGLRELCRRLDALAADPATFRGIDAGRHPRVRALLERLDRAGGLRALYLATPGRHHLLERRRVLLDALARHERALSALVSLLPGWLQFVRAFQAAAPGLSDEALADHLGEFDGDLGEIMAALRWSPEASAPGAPASAGEARRQGAGER